MQSNLIGRVDNTELAARNSLMPVFEALINSMWAIDEAGHGQGRIAVHIVREPSDLLEGEEKTVLYPIQTVEITDNGIGFTSENQESFETLDSRVKAHRGAKGIGRLYWLKAFKHAEISSTFSEDGKWHRRAFRFELTPEGIADHSRKELQDGQHTSGSSVRLVGFRRKYQDATPKRLDVLACPVPEWC